MPPLNEPLILSIATACGLNASRADTVQGGDINDCYRLYTTGKSYFLKLNDAARYPSMFAMEAAGLEALRHNSMLIVPEVIKHGQLQDKQWLLLQWIEQGDPGRNSMEKFGAALADMHKKSQPYFGWAMPNYIGSLQQLNTPCDSWLECYSQSRIMPMVKKLFDARVFSTTDVDHATAFCKQLIQVFPEEPPALLHGDLWGGNYMIDTNGDAVIFDPAVYYGHREMDLGMTKLFGGFGQSFYDAYHQTYPLEKNWQGRLPYTQLYPLLVHAVLFGGHYIQQVKEMMRKY